jgi:hypothetical protein
LLAKSGRTKPFTGSPSFAVRTNRVLLVHRAVDATCDRAQFGFVVAQPVARADLSSF